MLRVLDDELDFDVDHVCYYQSKPFSGISIEEGDGVLLSEIPYQNGLLHGVGRDWFPTGEPHGVSTYQEGVLHGQLQEWDRQGQLRREAQYEHGVKTKETRWDETGTLSHQYEISPSDSLYDHLNHLRERTRADSNSLDE